MLTVAYIGFGVSIREYHIPYVEDKTNVTVKYVYRREADIAQNAAYEPFYPEIIFTSDLNLIWNDLAVNLVVIGAPDKYHTWYATEALNHGKHTLVEKPFSATAAEARDVFDLARATGLVCMPNQNRRFDADLLAVKEVIASGKLGELVKLESHYDYFKTNGWYPHLGTLYNLAVHTIDQVISLFGTPDQMHYDVRSIHHPGVGDDYYDLDFHYGNMKATVNCNMCVLIDYPRFTVHGTRGSFTLPPALHGSSKAKVLGRHQIKTGIAPQERWGTLTYLTAEGQIETEAVPVGYAHYERIYDSLVEAIEHGTEKCIPDEQVTTVLEILEAATEVAKSHMKKD
ncbi:MAG: Gfo/Idh/MocA family oxidoreductase [Eubacteriales bacterium]|nr:Gfo/Idh/MocA family oxidoreductase [Eubacteriales bacterium]